VATGSRLEQGTLASERRQLQALVRPPTAPRRVTSPQLALPKELPTSCLEVWEELAAWEVSEASGESVELEASEASVAWGE